jgi:hypothetical protein
MGIPPPVTFPQELRYFTPNACHVPKTHHETLLLALLVRVAHLHTSLSPKRPQKRHYFQASLHVICMQGLILPRLREKN